MGFPFPIIPAVITLLGNARSMLIEDQDLNSSLPEEIDSLKSELETKYSVLKNSLVPNKGEAPKLWMLQLQDLAYQIEDFLDKYNKVPRRGALVRFAQVFLAKDSRRKHVKRIEYFQKRLNEIEVPTTPAVPAGTSSSAAPAEAALGETNMANPVGMEDFKRELKELLQVAAGAGDHQNQQRKVISILGCIGSGKTTLARALLDDPDVVRRFGDFRAMVPALSSSDRKSTARADLRDEVVRQFNDRHPKRRIPLQEIPSNERYLVIIDGVQDTSVCNAILREFPDNDQGSRVVVTTRNRTVASSCSVGRYLCTMPGASDPAELFWARFENPPADRDQMAHHLETLFSKSEGWPLVLVDAAQYLQGPAQVQRLTPKQCIDLVNDLRHHIASQKGGFPRTRGALVQCWDSLLEHTHQMCMLSIASFPDGHKTKRESLIRRWTVEGLFQSPSEDEISRSLGADGRDCLCKLLNEGIVQPVPSGDYASGDEVEWCRVHRVMLEFLVHCSLSWNFVALIKDGELVHGRPTDTSIHAARRVAIHGDGELSARAEQRLDLPHVRSLTVRSTNRSLSILKKCKLLRVLDLDDCSWLVNSHLDAICRMLHLRYLSLRNTVQVTQLPKAIGDLHLLETLDVRQRHTQVYKLPLKVLMLENLAHLFGKFDLPTELEDAQTAEMLQEFLKKESQLQTLAGFRMVNNRGFELILRNARMLKKVKIWCEVPSPSTQQSPDPAPAPTCGCLPLFRRRNNNPPVNPPEHSPSWPDSLVTLLKERINLDSISIDLGGRCKQFLCDVLDGTCSASSIKVGGLMNMLPQSTIDSWATRRNNILKLHLCKTGLQSKDLSVLQRLPGLNYLKLTEEGSGFWEGDFVVNDGGFPSLQRLCFHGPHLPRLKFEPGSMRPLRSLQLICQWPENIVDATGIEELTELDEVILHPCASDEKMEAWRQQARNHRNWPRVMKQT